MKFIEFTNGKQREFLMNVKEKSQLSWPKLANIINKSRSTILAYLREEYKIPQKVFDRFKSKYKIKVKDIKIISLKNTKKEIVFPEISNKFSEFLGVIAGDGHLHLYPAELSITCHAILDKKYIDYLYILFENLFNQKPTLILKNNVIKLRFYSKELIEGLNKKYGLPVGKKMNRLHIPKQIRNKKECLICFIRGLFDTDGTITRHHKRSGAIIEIISRDKQFLEEINEGLIGLKFKTSLGYKAVRLYDKNEIDNFFNMIRPSNPKHNLKYKIFKRTGLVPLTKELLMRR